MSESERAFLAECRHAQKMAKRKRQWSLLFVIILVALILGLMKIVTDMAEMTAMKSGRATAEAGQNLALSAFANEQTARAQAQIEKQIADDLARFANAQALVIQSQAALTRDPEFSMLVALKAMTYSVNPQVADALRETVFAFPLAVTLHQQPTQPEPVVRWIAFDRQTRHFAAGNAAGDVLIWSYDPQSDQWNDQPTVLHGHTGAVTAGAFSPDGTQLATAGTGGGHGNSSRPDQGSHTAKMAFVVAPTGTTESISTSTSTTESNPAPTSTTESNPAPTSPAYPNPTADSPARSNPAPAKPANPNPPPANPAYP